MLENMEERTKKRFRLWQFLAKVLKTHDEGDVRARKKGSFGFVFIMTFLAVFNLIVFYIYLNLEGILISFQNATGWTLGNYQYVIGQFAQDDGMMRIALKNTIIYWSVGYFIIQTLNIVMAYFFFKKIRGYKFFRAIFYAPNIIGVAVMSLMYKQIIGPEGPLVEILMKIGVLSERLQFLHDSRYAMAASVGYSLWLITGSVMLISCGAMARIPSSTFEAAALDGITPFKELTRIVIPSISGTLSTLYLVGVGGLLYSGGATLFLTQGDYGTTTFSFWMFQQLYSANSTGTSAALGIILTLITIPIIVVTNWLLQKMTSEVEY